VRYISKSAA